MRESIVGYDIEVYRQNNKIRVLDTYVKLTHPLWRSDSKSSPTSNSRELIVKICKFKL